MTTTTFREADHPRAAGGQFTHKAHAESGISLSAPASTRPAVDEHFVASVLQTDLSAADARAIADRVNDGLDFRPEAVRAIANDHHTGLYGVSLDDHDRVLQNISGSHAGEAAITHMRRMMAAAREAAGQRAELAARVHPEDRADDIEAPRDLLEPADRERYELARGQNVPVDLLAWNADVTDDQAPARTRYRSDSPFVREGGIADTVISPDGHKFYRARAGVYPSEFQNIRFQTNRPISNDEMNHLAQLAGYRYASTVRGESLDEPRRDSPCSFVLFADVTKGRGSAEGTAARISDRLT